MSTRPSGRLISTTSAHGPSPSAPISTSLKTQATYPPSVRERARNTRPPTHPQSRDGPPELYHRFFDIPPEPGARSHKVSTGEDWHILGMIFHISPDDLMYYNFHTTNPAYVNWYLREYVGCRVPDHRRMNWKFSNDADPGKIWIPPPKPIISQDITHLPKPFWRGSWGDSLDIPSGGPHVRTLTFEV